MRTYTKFMATFWVRGSGKALRGRKDAQILGFYLMTNQVANMSGIYYLSVMQMVNDTGLTPPEVRKALALLSSPEIDIAHYDADAELVYVTGASKHQVGDELKGADKRRAPLLEEVARVGSHPFAAAWWLRYTRPYRLDVRQSNGASAAQLTLGAVVPATAPPTASTNDDGNAADEAPPIESAGRGRKRAARSLMRSDWQPNEVTMAQIPPTLDAGAVIADFRDHWLGVGEMMADWNATFRNNVSKVMRTDYLLKRYVRATPLALAGPPVAPRVPRLLPPPPGPPAAAPPDLVQELGGGGPRTIESLTADDHRVP